MTCPDCPDGRTYTASGYATHRRLKHARPAYLVSVRLPVATMRRLRRVAGAARVSPSEWCEQTIARAVTP